MQYAQLVVCGIYIKMLNVLHLMGCHFELRSNKADSVKAKVAIPVTMQADNPLLNIDEEQILDTITAKQIGRIIEFLLNIEED
ncbi:MAG: hypothetical protein LBH79_05015 [Nitrososphaerota archaeon]|jgi:hypothetical protein|nr:hypothetical protein [Nitrososphaerota archaeon]